ncbi:hypothetical protein CZ787_18375 [Halomonas citrativorans]|uniref:Uncharacterized protein n=1 Tax=Halomonas citrativorans TaxID=2742612 RepID=A0A1R4I5K0_9GAMM|nr:hypothetical protein CZ787_18375 [Halomonas citrativorans]
MSGHYRKGVPVFLWRDDSHQGSQEQKRIIWAMLKETTRF